MRQSERPTQGEAIHSRGSGGDHPLAQPEKRAQLAHAHGDQSERALEAGCFGQPVTRDPLRMPGNYLGHGQPGVRFDIQARRQERACQRRVHRNDLGSGGHLSSDFQLRQQVVFRREVPTHKRIARQTLIDKDTDGQRPAIAGNQRGDIPEAEVPEVRGCQLLIQQSQQSQLSRIELLARHRVSLHFTQGARQIQARAQQITYALQQDIRAGRPRQYRRNAHGSPLSHGRSQSLAATSDAHANRRPDTIEKGGFPGASVQPFRDDAVDQSPAGDEPEE
jgi:hypothetical protein